MRMRRVPLMDNQRLWVKCKSCGKVIDSYHGPILADLDDDPGTYYHEVCAPQPGDVVPVEREDQIQERVNQDVDRQAVRQGFATQDFIDNLNFDPRN